MKLRVQPVGFLCRSTAYVTLNCSQHHRHENEKEQSYPAIVRRIDEGVWSCSAVVLVGDPSCHSTVLSSVSTGAACLAQSSF
jgi:hypothetical protein